jgi:hypothetical protein
VNLPFGRIAGAGLKHHSGGAGDIPLQLMSAERMALFMVWPHARPWRITRPEPMLRCIPRVEEAAGVLARALAVDAEMPVPYQPAAPARKEPAHSLNGQPAHA